MSVRYTYVSSILFTYCFLFNRLNFPLLIVRAARQIHIYLIYLLFFLHPVGRKELYQGETKRIPITSKVLIHTDDADDDCDEDGCDDGDINDDDDDDEDDYGFQMST